ncbi:hypothetical protein ACFWBX_05575 [Streptomyces sp. NPDC059991]|uniref:hypothetical protein n=1 Tax=Streptomyces sp. NPDC059991 TaxID=3347028 RepID=UPI00368D698D
MTIVENGRYHARHVPRGEVSETTGESELHKSLTNHTAETAGREGFSVSVEDRAVHGRRRTDVTVAGANRKKIGYEIALRVRGGVKALRLVRCDWSTQRECPKRLLRHR